MERRGHKNREWKREIQLVILALYRENLRTTRFLNRASPLKYGR